MNTICPLLDGFSRAPDAIDIAQITLDELDSRIVVTERDAFAVPPYFAGGFIFFSAAGDDKDFLYTVEEKLGGDF